VAISDPLGVSAQGVESIRESNAAALIARIAEIAAEREAGLIVVGLPLNMDGTEGDRAVKTRAFGGKLAEATGLEIEWLDERLTSQQADRILVGRSRAEKKRIQDVVAAQILLQCHLDQRS
jgi:putative Holliday junction resolvase